jgi:ribokinase
VPCRWPSPEHTAEPSVRQTWEMQVAVVGHIEWIEFGRVDRIPGPGDIAHATAESQLPGGGGAVAAVQLSRLTGDCDLFTAFGDDPAGTASRRALSALGPQVHAESRRAVATRHAITLVDASGERTITTLGERLDPLGTDPLPWRRLEDAAAVYMTAGDEGAFRLARRAEVMVVSLRVLGKLAASGVRADCLVGSARDPAERWDPAALPGPAPLVVRTEGRDGGSFVTADDVHGRYPAEQPPAPLVDTYGAGDTFAAALTFALGAHMTVPDTVGFAARCAAMSVTGQGPYTAQIV